MGLSCSHAISAVLFCKDNPQAYAYTQAFLSLDAYRKTYANAILLPNADTPHNYPAPTFLLSPENDSNNAENDSLAPPHVRCHAGKPRVSRIRSDPFGNKRV